MARRKKVLVAIDFDNLFSILRDSGRVFDHEEIYDLLAKEGDMVIRPAVFANWLSKAGYEQDQVRMDSTGFMLVQCPSADVGGTQKKSSVDDAIESHIRYHVSRVKPSIVVLASGDRDFVRLLQEIRADYPNIERVLLVPERNVSRDLERLADRVIRISGLPNMEPTRVSNRVGEGDDTETGKAEKLDDQEAVIQPSPTPKKQITLPRQINMEDLESCLFDLFDAMDDTAIRRALSCASPEISQIVLGTISEICKMFKSSERPPSLIRKILKVKEGTVSLSFWEIEGGILGSNRSHNLNWVNEIINPRVILGKILKGMESGDAFINTMTDLPPVYWLYEDHPVVKYLSHLEESKTEIKNNDLELVCEKLFDEQGIEFDGLADKDEKVVKIVLNIAHRAISQSAYKHANGAISTYGHLLNVIVKPQSPLVPFEWMEKGVLSQEQVSLVLEEMIRRGVINCVRVDAITPDCLVNQAHPFVEWFCAKYPEIVFEYKDDHKQAGNSAMAEAFARANDTN